MIFGCGKKLPSATIVRDDARTGGSLSFVYDKNQRTISIGGEGEVLQYVSASEEKGYEEGNRVGLKITAPDEKLDLSTAKLEMNGIAYSAGSFLETINGERQRFFEIFPIFSEDNRETCLKIVWEEGAEKQNYRITIVSGTKFMDKDGNIK